MSIAEKSIIIAENVPKVYQAGYEKGKADGGGGENIFYYAQTFQGIFQAIYFPENYNAVVKVKKAPNNMNYMFERAYNLKSIKFISEERNTANAAAQLTAGIQMTSTNLATLETVDFTEFNQDFTYLHSTFYGQAKLHSIFGALDVTRCNEFSNFVKFCYELKNIEFVPNTIFFNISFADSQKLSAESIQSIFDGLATVETARTLTLNANLKILQSQVDSANAKGWTIAGGTVVSEEEYYG